MNNPLISFNAEAENGGSHQAADPAKMRYERMCNEAQLDIDKEVPPPPVAIYIGDSPACTFGNFSASIGKPKGKKTFNVSAMTAAAMTNSTILNYRGSLPPNQNGILYFDTEQSTYHAFRVFKRIATLTRKSNQEINERIKYFALRKYSVEDRIGMIDHKIRNTPAVGLVIIDGIRDLMLDINNPREATLIVNYLMNWTEEFNLHLHTVIHQNKGDENARGHIGTEINNKSEAKRAVELERDSAMAMADTFESERDTALRQLREQKTEEQHRISMAVSRATAEKDKTIEQLQGMLKSSRDILNIIADVLYKASKVFRRAIEAIIHFATEQHKSIFSPSEAADIKSVMQSYGETTEQQKAVGAWLCDYAEHRQPFD